MNEEQIYNKAMQLVKESGVDENDIEEWIEAMQYATEDVKKGIK